MPATINIGVVPVGIEKLPWGVTARQQFVIPRYYNGSLHPAGGIEGWGPFTVLQSDNTTQNLSQTGVDRRYIVKTGGFGDGALDLSQWQDTSTGRDPACLQPFLRRCTVAGYPDYQADFYHGSLSYVNVRPYQQNISPVTPTLYGGFRGYGCGGLIEDVNFFYIPGTAIEISRPDSSLVNKTMPFDRLKWRVNNINVRRAFGGIVAAATDSIWSSIEVEDVRDFGFKVPGNVGGIQFGDIHTYGVGYIGGPGGGAGIWIEGGDNQTNGPLYAENGPIGVRIDGQHNVIDCGLFSHTCATNNIKVTAAYNRISGFDLDGGAVCVLYEGVSSLVNTLNNGVMWVPVGGTGIKIENPWLMTIHDVLIVGSYAARHSHGAVATNPTATGIDIDGTVINCDIKAHIDGMGTGINLSGATISNDGSVMIITTSNVATPVVWPSSGNWVTTFNAAETCDVRINGVRYYRP